MPSTGDPIYRPCVGIALFNAEGKVWIGQRARKPGAKKLDYSWQMPQGGIDDNEDPLKAALRELYEETNIRSVTLLGEISDWLSYDFPDGVVKGSWAGKYRGQTQKWFAFRFDGSEAEINIESPVNGTFKPEFGNWKWEDLAKTPELIVPFKRQTYELVVQGFRKFT